MIIMFKKRMKILLSVPGFLFARFYKVLTRNRADVYPLSLKMQQMKKNRYLVQAYKCKKKI